MGQAKHGQSEPDEYEDYNSTQIFYTSNYWVTATHMANFSRGNYNNIALILLDRKISDYLFRRKRAAIAKLPGTNTQITNPVVVAGYGTGKKYLYT